MERLTTRGWLAARQDDTATQGVHRDDTKEVLTINIDRDVMACLAERSCQDRVAREAARLDPSAAVQLCR
jgi:hypothetical protein